MRVKLKRVGHVLGCWELTLQGEKCFSFTAGINIFDASRHWW
jgi:hypothetical protein